MGEERIAVSGERIPLSRVDIGNAAREARNQFGLTVRHHTAKRTPPRLVADGDDRIDLHGDAEREDRHADRRTGMTPGLAEHVLH